jgi:aminomethyltransferase
MMSGSNIVKKTPLNQAHRDRGARMVEFAGWDMPVYYSGVIAEHLAVREKAGLFDVSHMGEIEIKGEESLAFLQRLTPNDVSKLTEGRIHYNALLYPEGTFVDDLLVYFLGENHYLLVVNAANTDKDYQWILDHKEGKVEVINRTAEYTQIAIQGPEALGILAKLVDIPLAEMRYYRFARGKVVGVEAIISRTGYTGEDGFELYFSADAAEKLWYALLEAGKDKGLIPVGLGARDTLRLEAKMALYGNDIDHTTTVIEADLSWIVKLEKGDFIGKDVLDRQIKEGISRKIIGFEMIGREVARHGYPVLIDGRKVGKVTSGSYAPYLKKNIGLVYLPIEYAEVGTEFSILVRNKEAKAKVVTTPFYKRKK